MIAIVTAVIVAAVAQAASIDWGLTGSTGGSRLMGQNGSALSGVTIYLVLTSDVETIEAKIEAGTFSLSTPGVLGSAVNASNTTVGNATATSGLLERGTAYEYTLLVFNETYTGIENSTGYYKFSEPGVPAVQAYDSNEDDARKIVFASGPDFNGRSWIPYTVIPEPTAMALLALGAAAVGLRRRFRK